MIIFLQFFGGLDSLNVFFVQMVKSVVFSHWINSRCVSFCLDNIRKDVPENPSILDNFMHLLSFCFYIPLSIGGPLINYTDFLKGVNQLIIII